MRPTTVVLITGHPASGKTTFARYLAQGIGLPLLCKDDTKEVLFDTLGWETVAWKRKLGITAWSLLYQQVEVLLKAHVDHIVEGNFDPQYANLHWQKLIRRFNLQLIQVRCECDPLVLLERDRERIHQGKRHPGHILPEDPAFYELVQKGPVEWIAVESARISVNTTQLPIADYATAVQRILELTAF